MSASMNMVIDIFKGGEAAANAIAEALYKAEGKRNKSILVSDSRIEVSNSQFYEIWGEDYLSPTSSLYEGFAKAAPEAEWHAHSYRIFEGGGEGCEAMDDAYYKEHVLKYAVELGIGSDTTIAASYLFTSNLKELSGAVLHKTVFAFRLAYITEIERAIGVKLPIILDSPSGKEVDQENINLMMDILKRDFSDHQIIISSIFKYNFDPLKVIEIVNRLIEIE